MNLADLTVKPMETETRLILDGALVSRIDRLREELKQARRRDAAAGGGLADEAPELERRLRKLELEADERTTTFKFRGIGRGEFEKLIAKHPPTETQWAEWREIAKAVPYYRPPEYDHVGLSLVLVAACCFDPVGSVEEWKRWRDGEDPKRRFSDGQWAELYGSALKVNTEASVRPSYGTGIDVTPSTGPDSTTPPDKESPSQSSTDES